ncbi:MAG: CDP-diacylglycerol--glycerol-3-phosphate 3-phosphatidyltransferase [Methylocystaceae bacterium]|nr:CDP-diacylglycerol--glycerol-3-phosphate 3-phosphatidyltransferase [Methylocystaceae bacterium]
MLWNVPNILTASRILIIPILVGLYMVGAPEGNWMSFSLYVYACITDFFDGWLARKMDLQSALGKFMDPIADKLLIATLIVMLIGFGPIEGIHVLAAGVILVRELLVSGLREFLAETKISVPVTLLAKWKTTIQMLALGFLIVGDAGPYLWVAETVTVGYVGLWIAALLTLLTGYDYLRTGLKHMVD